MRNIKITVEYDGTNYYGWQKQIGMPTVQGTIEDAIKELTGQKCDVTGSSRTDAGVHAVGFVANFKTSSTIPPHKFREALNTKLPNDIVIIKSEEVDLEFHARYWAKGKTYEYWINNGDVPKALVRNFSYHVKHKLDVEAMKEAAKYFIGEHDFIAFKTQGSSIKGTVRNIFDLKIIEEKENIKIFVTGDGFLYNMVRIIVGTLINVGFNRIQPEDIKNIILSKERSQAGPCVPSNGLCLKEVYY